MTPSPNIPEIFKIIIRRLHRYGFLHKRAISKIDLKYGSKSSDFDRFYVIKVVQDYTALGISWYLYLITIVTKQLIPGIIIYGITPVHP